MRRLPAVALTLTISILGIPVLAEAEQPCDRFPKERQPRCQTVWKQINRETESEIAKFGLDQLKRREEGKITAEQHFQENMAFIKQSTDKRLKLLDERMAQ